VQGDPQSVINGNGATFNGLNYYTIAAISGSVLTLQAGTALTPEIVKVKVSPVTIAGGARVGPLAGLCTPEPARPRHHHVIGGVGADTIDIGGSNNTVIGDDGKATYDPTTGLLTSITTTDPTAGGNDIINVTGGGSAILGGFGADLITVGGPNNTILGDNG